MAKPAINDWLMKGTVRFVEKVNGLRVFQHYELMLTQNIWHILWFWLSWKSRQYDFVRTTSIVVNLVFLECSEVPGVGMFKVS